MKIINFQGIGKRNFSTYEKKKEFFLLKTKKFRSKMLFNEEHS